MRCGFTYNNYKNLPTNAFECALRHACSRLRTSRMPCGGFPLAYEL